MRTRKLSGRTVYQNRWMRVREDRIRFPDGSDGIYGVVDKEDFVVIVPIHDDARFELAGFFSRAPNNPRCRLGSCSAGPRRRNRRSLTAASARHNSAIPE